MNRPLFVYGTLMTAVGHPLTLGVTRLGPALVRGRLWSLDAGYPALAPKAEGVVHGELLAPVGRRRLADLDAYEGVDEGLYERIELIAHRGADQVLAWAWIMRDPSIHAATIVPSGRWSASARARPADSTR